MPAHQTGARPRALSTFLHRLLASMTSSGTLSFRACEVDPRRSDREKLYSSSMSTVIGSSRGSLCCTRLSNRWRVTSRSFTLQPLPSEFLTRGPTVVPDSTYPCNSRLTHFEIRIPDFDTGAIAK